MCIIDGGTSHDIAGVQHDRSVLRRDNRGSRRPRDVSPDYSWPRVVGALDTEDTPPSPAPTRIRACLESAPPGRKPSHDRGRKCVDRQATHIVSPDDSRVTWKNAPFRDLLSFDYRPQQMTVDQSCLPSSRDGGQCRVGTAISLGHDESVVATRLHSEEGATNESLSHGLSDRSENIECPPNARRHHQ